MWDLVTHVTILDDFKRSIMAADASSNINLDRLYVSVEFMVQSFCHLAGDMMMKFAIARNKCVLQGSRQLSVGWVLLAPSIFYTGSEQHVKSWTHLLLDQASMCKPRVSCLFCEATLLFGSVTIKGVCPCFAACTKKTSAADQIDNWIESSQNNGVSKYGPNQTHPLIRALVDAVPVW